MRILKKHTGGMPLEVEDLTDQLQGGTLDVAKALASPFADTDGNCVLSGCEILAGQVSEGWVMLAGVLYYFPSRSVPAGDVHHMAFVADLQYDPAGLDNFADGNAKDTYELRYATLQVTPGVVVSPNLALVGGRRPSTLIGDVYKNFEPITLATARTQASARTSQDLAGSLINGWASPYVGACLSRRLENIGLVFLQMEIEASAATDIEAALLPPSYRPITSFFRPVALGQVPNHEIGELQIHNDGRLFVKLANVNAASGRIQINECYLAS